MPGFTRAGILTFVSCRLYRLVCRATSPARSRPKDGLPGPGGSPRPGPENLRLLPDLPAAQKVRASLVVLRIWHAEAAARPPLLQDHLQRLRKVNEY